jgi:tripartite-type tricarboxylate transporter receptor subunit TctC
MHRSAHYFTAGLLFVLLITPGNSARAQNFYEGKTIQISVGFGPGGGYDIMARLLARYMGRYIPGNPNIIVVNKPGASGLLAINQLYANLPKDGLYFGTSHSATPLQEALGVQGVQFKSAEMSWIGSLTQSVNVVGVTKMAGVKSLDDVKQKEVIMGATGSGGGIMSAYPRMLNNFFDTQFKIVPGYQGSTDIFVAMERNELHGGTTAWSSWKIARPDWIRDGTLVPLVQIGPKRVPDLPNVPLLDEIVKDDAQRQMALLLCGNMYIERSFQGPPGIPADRLETLRRAFIRTAADSGFIAEAAKLGEEIEPHTGDEVAQIVNSIVNTPRELVERMRNATGLE